MVRGPTAVTRCRISITRAAFLDSLAWLKIKELGQTAGASLSIHKDVVLGSIFVNHCHIPQTSAQ